LKTIYFENGSVKNEVPFERGKENGVAYEYDKNGNIIMLRYYKNGILTKQESINRVDNDGKKKGVWKEFDRNKNVIAEGKYRNG
jgi:antitoxin component YwqK of YwqJK toxin-antitoxin module